MLFGLDLKNYRIDDYQIFAFGGVPSINALNPIYGTGDIPFTGSAPFRNFLSHRTSSASISRTRSNSAVSRLS